ncbi:MAG: hypothetical protein GF398_16640 [Chitinivibrionales bacterium]|nr:hypothetical protein [Chitinivibrionales bacterium]
MNNGIGIAERHLHAFAAVGAIDSRQFEGMFLPRFFFAPYKHTGSSQKVSAEKRIL